MVSVPAEELINISINSRMKNLRVRHSAVLESTPDPKLLLYLAKEEPWGREMGVSETDAVWARPAVLP